MLPLRRIQALYQDGHHRVSQQQATSVTASMSLIMQLPKKKKTFAASDSFSKWKYRTCDDCIAPSSGFKLGQAATEPGDASSLTQNGCMKRSHQAHDVFLRGLGSTTFLGSISPALFYSSFYTLRQPSFISSVI